MTELAREYLLLALRLGRHLDGLIDAYYGPSELEEQVAAEEPADPPDLVRAAESLRARADSPWLSAQLLGLQTVAERLAGDDIPYQDEVERCYGVRPEWTPEEVFEQAHRELDAVLGGEGTLAQRYQRWREGNGLEGEALARVVGSLTERFRTRTEATFGLPAGEHVTVEYVAGEPWSAFNYYRGDLHSRIAVNTDVAMTPDFVAELVAHECYPGHHTERSWKEELLVRGRGCLEETAVLVGTPQGLLSEGIAMLALDFALGESGRELIAEAVDGAVPYDPEVSRRVLAARAPLGAISTNAALLLHARGGSLEEAKAYFVRWGLFSESRAAHQVQFLTDPLWRAYAPTYADGERLCRAYVAGDPERFRRLLTEQVTPAELAG